MSNFPFARSLPVCQRKRARFYLESRAALYREQSQPSMADLYERAAADLRVGRICLAFSILQREYGCAFLNAMLACPEVSEVAVWKMSYLESFCSQQEV